MAVIEITLDELRTSYDWEEGLWRGPWRKLHAMRRVNRRHSGAGGLPTRPVDVKRIEAEIAELSKELTAARAREADSKEALAQAAERQGKRAKLERTLQEAAPKPPSKEARGAAERGVSEAREALELGALVRRALFSLEEAEGLEAQADEQKRQAERLRNAAQRTDELLSEAVSSLGGTLKLRKGLLCLKTDRGDEPFDELSHGERWRTAIDIAVERLSCGGGQHRGGVLVIPQEAWEGLDPGNRQAIVDHTHKVQVTIMTAEATEGPLTVQVL